MAAIRGYLERSLKLLRKKAHRAATMDILSETGPQTIFNFTSDNSCPIATPDQFISGTDAQLGGLTTSNIALVPSQGSAPDAYSHMAFYGYMSTAIPPAQRGKIRTGFAGFRNASSSTLFAQDTWDLEMATHLKIVVAYRGWEAWRNRWVVNIGIVDRPPTDIFQHRLELSPSPLSTSSPLPLDPLRPEIYPTFSTLHLPLSSFVLIRKGQVASSFVSMPRYTVRTIGFALLGRDRDDIASALPLTPAAQNGLRGITLGGWGKGDKGELEHDPELRAMLEEDRLLGPDASAGTSMSGSPNLGAASGGYHRASPSAPLSSAVSAPDVGAVGLGDKEGYYELCVKSVEAVKWDPEMEGSGDA